MTKPDSKRWAEVSPYLDEALELDTQKRERWLAALAVLAAELHPVRSSCSSAARHEASLLARLTHPNIARLFDAGVRDNGQLPQVPRGVPRTELRSERRCCRGD